MKRLSLFLALALAPQLAFAQPDVKPQPDAVQADPRAVGNQVAQVMFAVNPDNARGVAMMGVFYNTLQNATSYKGHFVYVHSNLKDGTSQTIDWNSTWQKDAQTGLTKSRSDATSSQTQNGQTTSEKISGVDDGQTSRHAYLTQNVWTEKAQTKDTFADYSQVASFLVWSITMLRVVAASNLQVQKQLDNSTVVSSADGNYRAVFNADGNLNSWVSKRADEKTELRFESIELNGAIAPDTFNWTPPLGSTQVAPDKASAKINFNFGF